MSEPRPHWDDELIEQVRYVYNSQITYADRDEELQSYYDVIAAVEDWHRDHATLSIVYGRAERAEAAIRRVEDELLNQSGLVHLYDKEFEDGFADGVICAVEAIRSALEGSPR